MGTPIGYNVFHGDNRLFEHLSRVQPSVMVVIGNPPLAAALKRAYPGCEVVYRHYPDDRGLHLRRPADDFLNEAAAVLGQENRNIIVQGENEPGDWPGTAAWTMTFMDCAVTLTQRVGILVPSVGNPVWHADFEVCRPVIKRALEINEAHPGLVTLIVHEYADGSSMTPGKNPPDAPNINSLVRRYKGLAYNGKLPPIIVGEGGLDPGWKRLMGEGRFPNDEWYADYMLSLWNAEYAPYGDVLGIALYAWEPVSPWELFALADAGAFQSQLELNASKFLPPAPLPEPIPEPEPTPEPGDLETRLATIETFLVETIRGVEALRQQNERLEKRVSALTVAQHAAADALAGS